MRIDLSYEEREQLNEICNDTEDRSDIRDADIALLAKLVQRILHAADSEEDYDLEQRELDDA